MTRCAFSLLTLTLLGTVLACRTARHSSAASDELLAVIEETSRLVVLRGTEGHWNEAGILPRAARALRFSRNAQVVAWIEDDTSGDTPRMLAFVSSPMGSPPRPLGPLGLRRAEAMGLSVSPRGDVMLLDEAGQLKTPTAVIGVGTNPLWDDGGLTYVQPDHCLAHVTPAVCGDVLKPLEWRNGVLLARTNTALIWQDSAGVRTLPLSDVVDTRRKPLTSSALVIHRVDDDGVARDAVSFWDGSSASEFNRADVLIDAEWDRDSVLLVRKEARADLYELMLAHAPEEFGGEALAGEAVRLDLQTKLTRPIAGLERRRVRRLFRADY